jgi:soluble lytic murein transglycosylase
MRRILYLLPFLIFSPAYAADPAATYGEWKYLRDPATLQISFEQGFRFLKEHGSWPEVKTIQLRTEEAALNQSPSAAVMQSFCANFSPISGRGMVACANAGYGSQSDRDAGVRQAWLQGDFSPFEEKLILSQYARLLNHSDHVARTDRLLYEQKTSSAQRMMPFLSANETKLVAARIALITGARDAEAKLKAVPADLKNNHGLLLDRIRYRNKKGLNAGMRELFLQSPQNPAYGDEWWPLRAVAVREAMQAAQYRDALNMISRHGELKSEFLAEALWLKGWITLEYMHDSRSAYKDFYKLYNSVSTPVSLARGAYWAAKAATQNGNGDIARDWLNKAAQHPTVFYGQLAYAELHPGKKLELPTAPSVSSSEKAEFARRELPRVVRMLADQGDQKMVDLFLGHMGNEARTPQEFAQLAALATSINAAHGGVVVAKMALRKGVVLVDAGWPLTGVPPGLAIEPGLTLSISRQESEFDPKARSRANAQGLMQLLPGTASDTARKEGISFSAAELWNPYTNMTLGSAYLGRMIAVMEDSYILGIASYNAGPRNALNWARDFGYPPADTEGAINWIENIPFGETRNYVQRVLENLQVYRQLLKQEGGVRLEEDLKR